jgi:hypothetical protein
MYLSHCVESVLEIRRFLRGELGKLETGSEFAAEWMIGKRSCTPTTGPQGELDVLWRAGPWLAIAHNPENMGQETGTAKNFNRLRVARDLIQH